MMVTYDGPWLVSPMTKMKWSSDQCYATIRSEDGYSYGCVDFNLNRVYLGGQPNHQFFLSFEEMEKIVDFIKKYRKK